MVGMHSETIEDPLHDETCRKILLLTSKRELTGPAIAYALDLPLADCYRKIAALQRAGYLTIAGYSINARKRAHKIYRAKMDGIEVFYSRDRIQMRVPKRGPGLGGMKIEVIVPQKPKRE
ncbi:MAG: hypothetical protein GWN12_20750 [Thermoplasmata archaeon]|nr:helix-turn-helix transcriptional regulator [Thermoplasmata archaeon]NIS12410.1 helix-turn-helix transcriptional regulator [Thermoplasmata archaeon]NIW91137.1 hypothetical protein [Thermoplasmata archaeon]